MLRMGASQAKPSTLKWRREHRMATSMHDSGKELYCAERQIGCFTVHPRAGAMWFGSDRRIKTSFIAKWFKLCGHCNFILQKISGKGVGAKGVKRGAVKAGRSSK